jgi:pimeloyl-ACP methyl ester carboxylesterase
MRTRRQTFLSLVVLLVLAAPIPSLSQTNQDKVQISHPSGKYGVARIAYDWVDNSRPDTFSRDSGSHREIMIYVWYPTRRGLAASSMSEYLPYADKIAAKLSSTELEDGWGSSWRRVFSNQVLTDTHDKAPISSGRKRFPLLVFSPGQGVPAASYTTLLQEIVSRGYVVASIEPTYESPAVGFPDGRVIRSAPTASENRQVTPGENRKDFLERQHVHEASHLERLAADVRFVIDQLSGEAKRRDGAAPFLERTDFTNVGAWGHSIGGRAAARACQLDARIRACLNADGAGPEGPIFSYEGAISLRQPFMWIETTPLPPPTDAVLAVYGITRQEWENEHTERLAAFERELRSCASGSYHVTIDTPGVDHYSFTDWRMVEAQNREEFDKGLKALAPLEEYVIAFFDKYLKAAKNTILDKQSPASAGVSLKKYGDLR